MNSDRNRWHETVTEVMSVIRGQNQKSNPVVSVIEGDWTGFNREE